MRIGRGAKTLPGKRVARDGYLGADPIYSEIQSRRDGRVAEGGGLLNRYRVKSSIGGSNPPLSAMNRPNPFIPNRIYT
jgi:hypothetical protein